MNNGSSASAQHDLHANEGPVSDERSNDGIPAAEEPTTDTSLDLTQSLSAAYLRKRSEFLFNLLTSLDSLLYLELSAIYYMDSFFFAFFLRAVSQFTFLSPKPAGILQPKHLPFVAGILGSNLFCAVMHIFRHRPEAGEATRGYLHGSILIDFIGQKGPTSKFTLLILDIVVLVGQLITLAVYLEWQKAKTVARSAGTRIEDGDAVATPTQTQDLDAEEQGVLRDSAAGDDIELQPMSSNGRTVPNGEREEEVNEEHVDEEETSGLLQGQDAPRNGQTRALELYFSGQVVLADFHVIDTMRESFWDYRNRNTRV